MQPNVFMYFLRLFQNRRLEATVTGVLGWAFVKAGDCERALEAFRQIDKVPPLFTFCVDAGVGSLGLAARLK